MAQSSNSTISSSSSQLQCSPERSPRVTVLASCYSVNTATSTTLSDHHMLTKLDTQEHSGIPEVPSGFKSPIRPPLDLSIVPGLGISWPGNGSSGHKGEAAHAIPEECERLFCEHLSVIFFGERRIAEQVSLGMGASQSQPDIVQVRHTPIQHWLEVLDYTNDITYRGFVTSTTDGQPTMFVFLEKMLGHGLKTGLVALFELAGISTFDCSQIVACIPRSQDAIELEIGRLVASAKEKMADHAEMTSGLWIMINVSTALMFPKFLLHPGISRPRQVASPGPSELSQVPGLETSNDTEKFLEGHISCIRCSHCAADLCLTSQIISKGFTGRHGRALLVSPQIVASAVSIHPSSAATECLPNTIVQKPVSRRLVTGVHTVSDINCALCGTVLGWKYVSAEEETQRYKVGKFILESEKITTSTSWESTPRVPVDLIRLCSELPLERSPAHNMEFDSQDEDECEDLFAGIWSPGLAVRRRSRKMERYLSMFTFNSL
ncbi:yippee-domain-containing protein [Aspergillus saccharolyticus JOP 1030-1]|uniref:Yippee-domain-containing protein n=1 Tax=Aspergillus saccharolyticus JOP 1030-1 TaxID=1450539 RepID=A0A318ZJN9_9EURO|nr:yippee-domain-containing protein [Aspergillus saccharolyticus JOP 1030-1]PYH47716.1 yippee-domain-containing protein [Aspergillus saccharolyticus JOP 1030-1]